MEEKTILREIDGRKLSVIFDGTRMGEALAILIRFVDDEYSIHQRLIRMQLLAKSIAGEELATEIITVLQAHYKVLPGSLIGAMHNVQV